MVKRQPLNQAPDAVKELVAQLEKEGDCLVFENEHHQPVVSIISEKARRTEGARELRELLDSFPSSPYSEEETQAHIEQAIEASKGQPYPVPAKL
ncbi:MAG: hypothetical protein O7G87_10615 [bacterium]|nr:hypothetical protein [bacterium]